MLKDSKPVELGDYLDSVMYLVNLVGIDHVGLGPDFMEEMPLEVIQAALKGLPPEAVSLMQSIPPMPGFSSARDMPNVTAGLVERKLEKDGIEKVIGGNWLRLYDTVWI